MGQFGKGREPINLLKSKVLYAMENSKSNAEAARFLRVSYPTYKKYAKLYKDDETGQSLFELHKNQAGTGIRKPYNIKKGKYALEDILEGQYPEYPISNLKKRIITNAILEEKCDNCGFCERRVTDYTVPLLIEHIDGDRTNHYVDNLRLLCYNCYYQEVGNPLGGRMKNNY